MESANNNIRNIYVVTTSLGNPLSQPSDSTEDGLGSRSVLVLNSSSCNVISASINVHPLPSTEQPQPLHALALPSSGIDSPVVCDNNVIGINHSNSQNT